MKTIVDKTTVVKWEQLVGKQVTKDEANYIIVNSYDISNHMLSISEFIDNYPYTSEINTVDETKTLQILQTFGFVIEVIEVIELSENSYNKLKGLNEVGYGVLSLKNGIFYLNDLIPLDFLTKTDKEYIMKIYNNEKGQDGTVLLYSILNRK